jgi:hypothetical protein
MLGFSAAEKCTGPPTVFYEFCGTETVDAALHSDSLSHRQARHSQRNASALERFEKSGIPIGHLPHNHIFLNDRPRGRSRSSSATSSRAPAPPFLQELCAVSGGLRMADVARAGGGLCPRGSTNRAFLQRAVSELYQRDELQTVECGELAVAHHLGGFCGELDACGSPARLRASSSRCAPS